MSEKSTYKERKPVKKLKDFVHSFWMHENLTDTVEKLTIVPDSYFKLVISVKNEKVIAYFMTGIWTEEKIVPIAPGAIT